MIKKLITRGLNAYSKVDVQGSQIWDMNESGKFVLKCIYVIKENEFIAVFNIKWK